MQICDVKYIQVVMFDVLSVCLYLELLSSWSAIRCLGRGRTASATAEINSVYIRPVQKNLFLEFLKMQGTFMLHFDR